MNKLLFYLLLSLSLSFTCFSQEEKSNYKVEDSLFREDQFYVSIAYNFVGNRPSGFKQFSFSTGISAGFLRDFPVSKNRKWAIAPGIGYSYNNIKQFVNSDEILEESIVIENIRTKINTHAIDFPLELRWRNATPLSHKFWRVYTGVKASYVFRGTLEYEATTGNGDFSILDDINRWQYGVYLSVGYNTWNPYVYYGLNPIFKDGSEMSNFNLGFIFYIL